MAFCQPDLDSLIPAYSSRDLPAPCAGGRKVPARIYTRIPLLLSLVQPGAAWVCCQNTAHLLDSILGAIAHRRLYLAISGGLGATLLPKTAWAILSTLPLPTSAWRLLSAAP